jgi:hypothetical protein
MLATSLLSIILLALIAIQDFKDRSIYAWIPPLLFIAFFIRSFLVQGLDLTLSMTFINSAIIILQLAFLYFYFSIKNRKLYNIVDTQIGLGDIFFFFSIAPLFSVYNFLWFFTISLFFILITYLIILNKKSRYDKIPLAGILSLFVVIALSVSFFKKKFELSNDFLPF